MGVAEFAGLDRVLMGRALDLAKRAGEQGEVPVGAVVVLDGQVIGEGFNQPIGGHDPTAHAEIAAIRMASTAVANYRLPGAALFVTLEPCTMCVGALVHARIDRLVFATNEPKAGAVVSTAALLDRGALNHRVEWQSGLMASESSDLLTSFFARRRAEIRQEQREGSLGHID